MCVEGQVSSKASIMKASERLTVVIKLGAGTHFRRVVAHWLTSEQAQALLLTKKPMSPSSLFSR